MASTTPPTPKGFRVPGEAYLIAVVVICMGVMLNHAFEVWSPGEQHGPESPKAGISLTHNFTGDALADSGVWGEQTSAMNFCEEDYTVTPYIAEFINTVSNFAYMYYAYTNWPPAPTFLPITNMSLFIVGLVSAVFHATLQHYTQIADESGMYLLVASMDWHLYSYPGAIFSGSVAKPIFGTVLWGACAAVIYINFTAGGADFGIHSLLFIALLTMLWPRCMYLIAQRHQAEKAGLLPAHAIPAKTLRRRFRIGASCFLLGFGVWLVDCAFCHELRAFRERIGMPLAWLAEMHGWWHVLTAVGAGAFVELTNVFSSKEQGNVPLKKEGEGEQVRIVVNGVERK